MAKILVVYGRDARDYGRLLVEALNERGYEAISYDQWELKFGLSTAVVEVVRQAIGGFDHLVCVETPGLHSHQIKKFLPREAQDSGKLITAEPEEAVETIIAKTAL